MDVWMRRGTDAKMFALETEKYLEILCSIALTQAYTHTQPAHDDNDDGEWRHGKQNRAACRLAFWMLRGTDAKMFAKQTKMPPGDSRGLFRCM